MVPRRPGRERERERERERAIEKERERARERDRERDRSRHTERALRAYTPTEAVSEQDHVHSLCFVATLDRSAVERIWQR